MGIIYTLQFFQIQGIKREKRALFGVLTTSGKGDFRVFVFLYSGGIRESFLTKSALSIFSQVSLYIWPNAPGLDKNPHEMCGDDFISHMNLTIRTSSSLATGECLPTSMKRFFQSFCLFVHTSENLSGYFISLVYPLLRSFKQRFFCI